MVLSHFNSYFEIFVGLNLGYATFKYFRKELETRIFKARANSSDFMALISRITTQTSKNEVSFSPDAVEGIKEKVNISIKALDLKEKRERCFFEILKPISFLLFLDCMAFLVIAGFQEQAIDAHKEFYNQLMFNLTCFSAVFSFTIFYCSFSDRVIKYKFKITVSQVIFAFVIFLFLSCQSAFTAFLPHSSLQLWLLPTIPVLIYLGIKVKCVYKVEKYRKTKFLPLMLNFLKLTWSNRKHILTYLVILGICYIPVILFRHNNTFFWFIEYLIILITPSFLFLFVAIRVKYHKRIFINRYRQMNITYTDALNLLVK